MIIYLLMIDNDEDKSKFEKIYLAYKKTMMYVANDILKDTYFAEDAVHEAFIRIIDYLDRIGDIECQKTKSFVIIVVKNIAIDMYRKNKKDSIISFDDIELNEIAITKDDYEEDNQIIVAIASLPAKYSSVLILKYSQGYSDREIAHILSITQDNVRQRIVRARKKLELVLSDGDVKI